MVENNDLQNGDTMNSVNVKLITDKKKLLEESTLSIREEIKSSFEHLISVLKSREKQLLRQVEAVHVQQLSLIQSNLELVSCKPLLSIDLSSRCDLESQILHLGKLEIFGKNGISVKDTEPYKVQEYQDADKDHESFNKSIKSEETNDPLTVKNTSISNISVKCDDSTINCSCNSSMNSSIKSEDKSDKEPSVFSISNDTGLEKKLFSTDNEMLSDYKGLEISKNLTECEEVLNNAKFSQDINANKEEADLSDLSFKNEEIRRDSAEHPKQIQQWLQQILVETETEPMVHEIEQFSEISKARLSSQFPLET